MPPNRRLALEKYRRNAPGYDRAGSRLERGRSMAVGLLRLRPGAVVLDVGCGTGLSFPLLEQGVGSEGAIIGIDQSPDMVAQARKRVDSYGWQNVSLVESPIEEADIPRQADAALFCFVHDILQTPPALENVTQHVRPGGHVAAAGTCWASWWLLPVNLYVWWYIARSAMTTLEGLGQPWRQLERFVPDIHATRLSLGQQYVASGVVGKG